MSGQTGYTNLNISLEWEKEDTKELITLKCNGKQHKICYDLSSYPKIEEIVDKPDSEIPPRELETECGQEFQRLFFPPGPLTDYVSQRLKELSASENLIRLRLLYPKESDKIQKLLQLPWEYLYIDTNRTGLRNGFLCLNQHISLIHCLKPQSPVGLVAVKPLPLKASFYFYLPEDSEETSTVYTEVAHDLEQYGRSNIVQLIGYFKNLKLKQGDIHLAVQESDLTQILCHGKAGSLNLADGLLTHKEVEKFAQGSKRAKVVIFIACHSGKSYNNVAVAFHKAEIPVVIGMTRAIPADKASSFLEALYMQLAGRLCSVEQALAVARLQLYQEDHTEKARVHWGLPRLFMRSENSDLIDRQALYTPVYNISIRKEVSRKLSLAHSINYQPFSDCGWPQTLREWINSKKAGILYLYGRGGSAKSTAIAQLLKEYDGQTKSPKLLGHFCLDDDPHTSNPLTFIRDSLYPQLEEYYGADRYRRLLGDGVFPVTAYNARFALYNLVLLPLSKAKAKNLKVKNENPHNTAELPTILIDAIDEAADRYPSGSILDLLIDHQHEIAQVARVIITGNYSEEPGSTHQRICKELAPEMINISEDLGSRSSLPRITAKNLGKEIPDSALRRLTLKHLNTLCRPEQKLQLRRFLLDCEGDLENVLNTVVQPDNGQIPLENYYQAYLNIIKGKDVDKDFENLLRVLVVAYKPLSENSLKPLFPEGIGDISDTLDLMPAFFDKTDGLYTCRHTSIKRFLDKTVCTNKGDEASAHKRFTNLCPDLHIDTLESWNGLKQPVREYVQNYAALHAYESYRCACHDYMKPLGKEDKENKEDDVTALNRSLSNYLDSEGVTPSSLGDLNYSYQQHTSRIEYAGAFLNLIIQRSFREFRMYTKGTAAAIDDMLFGLRVILFEYTLRTPMILDLGKYEKDLPGKYRKYQEGFARLVTAYEHMLDILTEDKEKDLIGLERKVRGLDRWEAEEVFKEYLGLTGEYVPYISKADVDRTMQKQ